MPRALGSNALLHTAFEGALGTAPAAGATWFKTPFVSSNLGEEQGLIESDLLGLGRETLDPTPDVINNAGDLVVPVDTDNFGRWLKLALGAPATTDNGDGSFDHVFTSGALALPSMSIEVGHPDISTFSNNYGARLNQMRIALARSGLLNATLGLICIGESDPVNATIAGVAPTVLGSSRFAQATGSVKKDGAEIGSVVSAEFTLSNGLDPVETIKADGRIEDADPGMFTFSGSVTIRYKDSSFQTLARNRTAFDLSFGWTFGTASLIFDAPRVFLPRTKRPVTGPKGIQQTFNFQGSGASGHTLTATLVNTVDTY